MFGLVDIVAITALVVAYFVLKPIVRFTAKAVFVVVCFIAGFVLALLGYEF